MVLATDGEKRRTNLQNMAEIVFWRGVEKSIQLLPGELNVTAELKKLSKTISRVILFFVNNEDAKVIYRDSSKLLLDRKGYVWLVAEQALTGHDGTLLAPIGSISIQLVQGSDEKAHLFDSLDIVTGTINSLELDDGLQNIKFLDNGCHSSTPWSAGRSIYEKLLNTSMQNGLTGNVEFNDLGDRKHNRYRIVNVQKSGVHEIGDYQDDLVRITGSIVWLGDTNETPKGTYLSKHLRIVTVKQHPFVYVEDRPPGNGTCSDLNKGNKYYVECTGTVFDLHEDHDKEYGVHCCSGFCIGLLKLLSEKINFTYDVHLSEDGRFGSFVKKPGSEEKRWNGMVGEILEDKADMIIASLTINNERARVVDFSKPFKYQGITILVKKSENPSSLGSFLRPFQIELWLLVLLSVHVVAVILYLLDRFSPFGRFQLAKSDKDETPLNLSSAMWFSWGVLLNSGIGEGTPRSFSARVLGMVWAGFAMIIVASYTANLAAFLVLDRPKAVVSGIDDPHLRNPTSSFTYATVANSSVDDYFRRQVELSTMYTFMSKYNVDSAEDGIEKVRDGELKAFIWDSPILYHESSKDCSLTTAGELFGRSAYGIGLPKDSPWTNEVSLAILNFHESGKMEALETAWIDIGNCPESSNAPATLGLSHMLGVFIMVLAGIGAGVIIIILEILYHKHRGWRADQRDLAKKTTELWKSNVMMTKNGRTHAKESNGVNGEQNGHAVTESVRTNPVFVTDAELY
ncbi:glutamate receptor ionotropic, NMDA 1-like isoform X2 [Dendronephthya gigantea]|uniref:glutamate receptor ionotropic, NMDA 1-like isoform X2 n=1 Tax=Dendronephthya gigantea TaxID=151771 RepID=UPI00106CBA82|nr:glutamate receptor ionotropic, NMDA 1-like isoform X2 [Dendronephthya gigantea]